MRFRQRHVHESIVQYITNVLSTGGWMQPNGLLGAGMPITVLDYEPQQAGEIVPMQSVCISIGVTKPIQPYEMGTGGLLEKEYPVFVDIYPVNESIGISIGEDIEDAIAENYIELFDFSGPSPVDTGNSMEIKDVVIEPLTGQGALDKRSWRVVKFTACLRY